MLEAASSERFSEIYDNLELAMSSRALLATVPQEGFLVNFIKFKVVFGREGIIRGISTKPLF